VPSTRFQSRSGATIRESGPFSALRRFAATDEIIGYDMSLVLNTSRQ
jgi:hypothetical protein